MTNELCYRPSGQYSMPGAGLALALGLAAAGILGPIYGAFTQWLPIAGYVTFLLAVGLGFAIGIGAAFGITSGHVRNGGVATVVGALAGLAGLYLAWVGWIRGLLNSDEHPLSFTTVLLHPGVLWDTILKINQTGAWSLRGSTPSGGLLWCLWALEAVLIVVPAALVGRMAASEPYCERCHAWCTTKKDVARRRAARGDEPARLQQKDLGLLQAMGAPEAGASDYLRLDLASCLKCGQMHTLSASNLHVSVDAKGKRSERSSDVVTHLLLAEHEADAIRKLASAQEPTA